LAVLKNDVALWRLKYLEEVSRRAKEIFRAVLYPDHQPWANGLAYWRQGKGFRHKVAENVQAWLKDNSREWMEEAIEGIIVKDWRVKDGEGFEDNHRFTETLFNSVFAYFNQHKEDLRNAYRAGVLGYEYFKKHG
jgi:hypothetical protein